MKRIPKVWQYRPRDVFQVRLARWFAGLKGFTIDRGNWIHGPSGKPVAHGWSAFYDKYRAAILEVIWGAEAVVCASCGAVQYGNLTCSACRRVMRTEGRASAELLDKLDAAGIPVESPIGPEDVARMLRKLDSPSTDTPIGGYCATGDPGAES